MKQLTKKTLIAFAKIIAAVTIVLLLWWLCAAIAHNDLVLPTPLEVLRLTFQLLGKGEIYLALLLTLLRSLLAFVASMAVALAAALLVGVFVKTKPYVDGVVTFFRSLPTISIILLAMIAFESDVVPAVVAFLVAFPIIYSAFIREIFADAKLLQVCNVYNVSSNKKVGYVLLPLIKQSVFPQCKDTLPLCIKVVIAGEVLALPRLGLGREMYVAKINLLTANVLALTLLSLVVCFAVYGVFSLCQRKVK